MKQHKRPEGFGQAHKKKCITNMSGKNIYVQYIYIEYNKQTKTKQSPATDFPSLCACTDEYILMC